MSERKPHPERSPEEIERITTLRNAIENLNDGYLILTRKLDEGIAIEPNILIKVFGIDELGRVKIGIKTTRKTGVFRTEIFDEIPPDQDNPPTSQ